MCAGWHAVCVIYLLFFSKCRLIIDVLHIDFLNGDMNNAISGVDFLYSRLSNATLLFNYFTALVNQIIKLSASTKNADLLR